MQPTLSPEPPPPDPLTTFLFGTVENPMEKLPILRAGIELQVWAKIAAGSRSADEVAAAAGADRTGMRLLLDALAVMKVLVKEGTAYRLPDWAEIYLLPGKPAYLGDFLLDWLSWEGHGQLAGAIRSGQRPIIPDVTRQKSAYQFLPYYAVRALAPRRSLQRYEGYWQLLGVAPRDGLRLIDLAGGVGIASFALAQHHPGVRVTLQDRPDMLDLALQAARTLGLEGQVDTLPGDLLSVDFGRQTWDIARLGFVTYFFGRDDLGNVFQRTRGVLSPGGMLVIEAPLSDESHSEGSEAVLDGPWLYAVSARGDVYSFSDYQGMLEAAGFSRVTLAREDLIKAER